LISFRSTPSEKYLSSPVSRTAPAPGQPVGIERARALHASRPVVTSAHPLP
jgi:hypothetical protein